MDNPAIKAFVKAQTEMGKALKTANNPHLKSKYADLNSVMDAAMPALHDNGFGLMQPSGADERGQYVDTILIHESGERFESRVYLVMGKQDMQALGSAQTYARRYGLLGMAGIAPEDDDGEATKAAPRPQNPPFNPKAAADRVCAKLNAAASEADILAVWESEADTRKAIHAASAEEYERVKQAAADRKESLTPSEAAA